MASKTIRVGFPFWETPIIRSTTEHIFGSVINWFHVKKQFSVRFDGTTDPIVCEIFVCHLLRPRVWRLAANTRLRYYSDKWLVVKVNGEVVCIQNDSFAVLSKTRSRKELTAGHKSLFLMMKAGSDRPMERLLCEVSVPSLSLSISHSIKRLINQ
jgi:hypothetical protein